MIKRYFHQLMTGVSFGMTSGVITSLGMIVGLHSATSSRLVVIAGIIIMAIADGLSDAAGMHISEESELEKGVAKHNQREIWAATIFTFISKLIFTLTFAIPFLIFSLKTAILAAIIWGILLLIFLNFIIAKIKQENSVMLITEHVLLAIFVIVISHGVGNVVARWVR
jgi:VIT1/CCC1 family predicted Fe2+/Mn2+ transporter